MDGDEPRNGNPTQFVVITGAHLLQDLSASMRGQVPLKCWEGRSLPAVQQQRNVCISKLAVTDSLPYAFPSALTLRSFGARGVESAGSPFFFLLQGGTAIQFFFFFLCILYMFVDSHARIKDIDMIQNAHLHATLNYGL